MTTYLIDTARADTSVSQQKQQIKASDNERLVRRIRAEFLEMPGLCLTIEQAQRLWSLEPRTCEALLNSLINSRFLRRTDRGLFVLRRSRG